MRNGETGLGERVDVMAELTISNLEQHFAASS